MALENYHINRGDKLGAPIPDAEILYYSDVIDLPFDKGELARIADELEGTFDVTRSVTDGRAAVLPPVMHSRELSSGKKIRSMDLVIKGIGAHIKDYQKVRFFLKKENGDRNAAVDGLEEVGDLTGEDGQIIRKLRYTTQEVVLMTSFLGAHFKEGGIRDEHMSEYLESSYGLRTRRLGVQYSIPDDLMLFTQKGEVSVKDFVEETGIEPDLEIWSMRSRYRAQDIPKLIREVEEYGREDGMNAYTKPGRPEKKISTLDYMDAHDGMTPKISYPDVHDFSEEQLRVIKRELNFLRSEILLRAKFDEDSRFSNLGKKVNLSGGAFWKEYLKIFSEVLGEQFGIMEYADAHLGMPNHQNITLLAELVDHDATTINNKYFNDTKEWVDPSDHEIALFKLDRDNCISSYNQLSIGFTAILHMMRDLSRTGIITLESDFEDEIFTNYFLGYLAKNKNLKYKDQMLVIARQVSQTKPAEEIYDPYSEDHQFINFAERFLQSLSVSD